MPAGRARHPEMSWSKKHEFLFWFVLAVVIAAYAIVLYSIMAGH